MGNLKFINNLLAIEIRKLLSSHFCGTKIAKIKKVSKLCI